MGRRKNQITFDNLQKAINAGLGMGTGKHYRPFIQFGDFSSLGTNTRFVNHFIGRSHNALSQLELRWITYWAFQENTVDLQEQYPLIRDRLTLKLAAQYSIKHPSIRNQPVVMTTDLLLTTSKGEKTAYSVKYVHELAKHRVQESLFLEKKYWEYRGVSWAILTEENLPVKVVENISRITTYSLSGLSPEKIKAVSTELTFRVVHQLSRPLFDIALDCDCDFDLREGTSLNIAKHLITTKRWRINLEQPFRSDKPLVLLSID